jgi:hypothetical protein
MLPMSPQRLLEKEAVEGGTAAGKEIQATGGLKMARKGKAPGAVSAVAVGAGAGAGAGAGEKRAREDADDASVGSSVKEARK